MRREAYTAVLLAVAAALAGCVGETREIPAGVSSFEVRIDAPADLGDESQGRAIIEREFAIEARAVGVNGERPFRGYHGTAMLSVLYGGRLQPLTQMTFVEGAAAAVTVAIPRVYGKAVLWVEDSMGEAPTWAAGASPDIFFGNPTIADLQASSMTTPPYASDLVGYQLRVGGQSGIGHRLVVTSVTDSGLFITDIDGAPGKSNSMYVFNYSRPKDVAQGDNLLWFSGGVAEHLGTTQITFPTWEVCNPRVETWCDGVVPAPVVVTNATTYDPMNLEVLESALVEVDHVQIQDVDADAYDRSTYDTYGQFKVRMYDASGNIAAPIQVVAKARVPDFDPRQFKMTDFDRFRGVLTELNFKPGKATNWIINVRDKCDICGPGYCPCGE